MKFGKRLQIFFLSDLFIVWLITLLLVILPTSGLVTPTFPFTVDYQYKLAFFITSTTLASGAFLIKGIQLLLKLP